nr:unnamed protein product [Callosobruchus analis]
MHPMRISICVILAVGYSCAAPGADPVARASPAPIAKADPTPEAKAEAAAKAKAEARPEAIPVPVPVPSYWPSPLSAFGKYIGDKQGKFRQIDDLYRFKEEIF